MFRPLLLLTLAAVAAGCQPCNERCVGGWRVSLESEATLADGRYEVLVSPDDGPSLEASCVIAEQGTEATCEGSLRAVGESGSDAFDTLLVEQPAGATDHVEVLLFWNDELLSEASVELELEPTESCNPHCAWRSASVPL